MLFPKSLVDFNSMYEIEKCSHLKRIWIQREIVTLNKMFHIIVIEIQNYTHYKYFQMGWKMYAKSIHKIQCLLFYIQFILSFWTSYHVNRFSDWLRKILVKLVLSSWFQHLNIFLQFGLTATDFYYDTIVWYCKIMTGLLIIKSISWNIFTIYIDFNDKDISLNTSTHVLCFNPLTYYIKCELTEFHHD